MKTCANCIYKTKVEKTSDTEIWWVYECPISGHDITSRVDDKDIPPRCTEYAKEDTKTGSLF